MKYIDVKERIYEIMLEKLVNVESIEYAQQEGNLVNYVDEIGKLAFDLSIMFAGWGFIDSNSDSED